MLNIEKYKDEIIEEYQNLIKTTAIDGDGNRMNKAIRTIAYKHCGKILIGASNPFKWLCEEYKEPILNDGEKEIVKAMIYVIHKLGGEVDYVIKNGGINEKAYILLSYTNRLTKHSDGMTTPLFKNNKFKGMKADKEYTLEELGITCQTQKDS